MTLSTFEYHPAEPVTASVIWLHGLGADGTDFVPLVPHLGCPGVRYVFPNAPRAPVTVNGGQQMPSWYDIRTLDARAPDREDPHDVKRAAAWTSELIDREVSRGVPEARIILAGFSQGGAVALYTGLRAPRPLAGLIALSTYLVLEGTLAQELTEPARQTPVFFGHGNVDDVVHLDRGLHACTVLSKLGVPTRWTEYRMGHSVNADEIQAIAMFLRERLG